MSKMKAAIYTGIQEIEIQEVERTAPGPGYVTLDTKQAGICGSDLHSYFGHWNQSHTLAAGHETCGIVVEVGEGVTEFQPGDKVTVECFSHCGRCVYCRTGHYNHCLERKWVSHNVHGGFAEYTTAHASGLFKLPDSMSFEEGALVEPLAVSYRAVAQAAATYQDRVAVIGGGTIGQFCLAAAKAAGVKETLITVKYDQQAQLAKELGADHVVHIGETDPKEYVNDLTSGFGMDAVIETVGGGQNFDTALAIVRPRGAVVLVAGYFEPLEVNLSRIVWSEAIVTGSNCYGNSGMDTDFQASIDLITSGKVDATKLVTHRFPLTEVTEAFKVAADKRSGAIKVHLCQ
ncbi:MAG: alcohol dehydrogenase catalytic domain-containing protein [Candidatus Poribacteria bacterium]|nr:alcohol dehydrogenase catalytic domain-containing protein [Candidatus Poribacteria bacterium]